MNKIKIKIKDDETFGEVAFLVDRDDFLEDIKTTRKLLKINKPIAYARYKDFVNRKNEDRITYTNFSPQQIGQLVEYIARALKGKYKKPFYFAPVIQKSIVCGEVREKDVVKAELDLIYVGSESEEMDWDRRDFLGKYDTSLALIFTPHRHINKTFDELKKIYKKQFPKVIDKYKSLVHYDDMGFYMNAPKTKPSEYDVRPQDTRRNIGRDRDWYWQKKRGKTYLQIARGDKKERGKIKPEDFEDLVKKAVRRYHKTLQGDV